MNSRYRANFKTSRTRAAVISYDAGARKSALVPPPLHVELILRRREWTGTPDGGWRTSNTSTLEQPRTRPEVARPAKRPQVRGRVVRRVAVDVVDFERHRFGATRDAAVRERPQQLGAEPLPRPAAHPARRAPAAVGAALDPAAATEARALHYNHPTSRDRLRLVLESLERHAERHDAVDVGLLCGLVEPPPPAAMASDSVSGVAGQLRVVEAA